MRVVCKDNIHLVKDAFAFFNAGNNFRRNTALVVFELHNFDDFIIDHVNEVIDIAFVNKCIDTDIEKLFLTGNVINMEQELFLSCYLSGPLVFVQQGQAVLIELSQSCFRHDLFTAFDLGKIFCR